MKGDHEVSYERLLDEGRERAREANLINYAVAAIDPRDEVRRISRRRRRHRLSRETGTASRMGPDRNVERTGASFSPPFLRSHFRKASTEPMLTRRAMNDERST